MTNIYDFTIKGIDACMANAIRRTMISKIPSVAIDNVCVIENDTEYCDEIIVHRLGLIPFKKMSDDTEVEITLEEIGPKIVYASDLKYNKDKLHLVHDKIILVNLESGKKIKISATTDEGTGLDHAKWNVCCGTSYKKISDDSFEFHIETTGVITPIETLNLALTILKEELISMKKMF